MCSIGRTIPKESRREICNHLRDEGLSLRAISSAIGYDKHTIASDLAANFKSGGFPPPSKQMSRSRDASPVPKTNIGNSSKHADPPDRFWKRATDLCKMVDRMAKIADDGGFCSYRERVREASLRDLLRARSTLDEVIAKLEGALV